MTILQENHHNFQIVEHDPLLYEDAEEMVEYVAHALKIIQGGHHPALCDCIRSASTEDDRAG